FCAGRRKRWRTTASKFCNMESWRRRLPISIWLPNYCLEYLLRDAIAGITVGLTSIPQGIAYAILAGLPPQVGLYSSIFPGIVYAIFGSCKDVTVGPTAILAALLAKYVARSPDFAYLATFLSGCLILLLGVLQLGFLLDFISKPVISGFTTAAALQISATQLKSLFHIKGASGGTFITALINFFKNIKTVQLWDTVLGVSTIIVLLLLKRATIPTTSSDGRIRVVLANIWLYVVRARNALVVFVGLILAYVLSLEGITPFALTGTIQGGLPNFGPPPFSTTVDNKTHLNFEEMLQVFGPEGFAMPLVAILESIAIAKAFAGSATVDATQEMIAIGACNMLSSLAQSMPVTGSFTRTALNHASGVITPAGSLFKASLVLLSVTLLAEAFYFIPRATLAGIIMVAMMSIIDFTIVKKLWINNKPELLVWLLTLCVGVSAGLEYGIAAGAGADALRALAAAARPRLYSQQFKVGNQDCVSLCLQGALSYACAEHVPRELRARAAHARVLVLDARHLRAADFGVFENLVTVILDLEKQKHRILLWNFDVKHQKLLEDLHPGISSRFVSGPSIDQFILDLNTEGMLV
ncbi:sodium-independent sulfate anion transporter-like, partial [Vanessa cardui]|uniref:sodium-independent sulfate anion transporter-like n=1 Tax=Vanessa cardui TaxID=171605 RepID=UPI001F1381CF